MTAATGSAACQQGDPQCIRVLRPEPAERWLRFLEAQVQPIVSAVRRLRPWDLWELHNPWSRASAAVDSWGFLDLCQSAELLSALAGTVGPDIVLFDSQVVPGPAPQLDCTPGCGSDIFFPVEPLAGAEVRISFRLRCGAGRLEEIVQAVGRWTPADAPVAAFPEATFDYVIRYFPATSLYIRDAGHERQLRLQEALPWINYVSMPLWLVRGSDRAGNDFATGFRPRPGRWTAARS